jgi:DNA-directed RNA polymerase subunit RPC12/RpoP
MIDKKKNILCGKCKKELDEEMGLPADNRIPCPKCGSLSRKFHKSLHGELTMKSKLKMKGRHAGGGKPFIEKVTGDDLHRKSNKWMRLERTIDRENNKYHEVVTDPSTGEITHECKEPLSKHRGHGAAKPKKIS